MRAPFSCKIRRFCFGDGGGKGLRSEVFTSKQLSLHAVLLFGSEMWKLSPLSLRSLLEGFHIWATHHIAGKMPTKNSDRNVP